MGVPSCSDNDSTYEFHLAILHMEYRSLLLQNGSLKRSYAAGCEAQFLEH